MSDVVREMTFDEEANNYEAEARAEFAKENGYGESSVVNNILRRGMRIVRKARGEIEELQASVVALRKRANEAEDFICMQCTECDWSIEDGIWSATKRCCSWFPECSKFRNREGWIPVTEGLPHFSPSRWRKVIVTMEDDSGKRFTTTAIFNEKYKEWYGFADKRYERFRVVAWRMKPEVYNG